jgi:arylsulfatase A-like enzyme
MNRLLAAFALLISALPAAGKPPNVVLVVTDDQGYGDLGCHGNPVLKTPNIDQFAAQAVECTHFYVSPVCAPTRASLLTGRYHFRTGVVDTFNGRALMRPDELTLGQMFSAAGYRTGIFGKWHLGDNFPLRPQDRGFHEVLMLRGGGIGQPSDPPGTSYYRPVLEHNGRLEKFDCYCTDLFTDLAIKFIEPPDDRPFFVYLPYNCPHTPLEAPEAETATYQRADLTSVLKPGPKTLRRDQLAKLYGMETNIDSNFGRLLAKLEELKLADKTIVVFLSDNGPQENRYNAGLRGLKGSVHEGGIRVPFFVRWPAGGVGGGRKVHDACAHIDILPSLAAACGLRVPRDRAIDGIDLLPRWRGEGPALADRTLYFQWHRGDVPTRFRACAVREPQYKLVQSAGERETGRYEPKFELFDIVADPNETNDISASRSGVVVRMKAAYERWFADVTATGFAPVRPRIGTPNENPTRLTRQDWRGPQATRGLGYWEVNLPAAATFDVTLTLPGAVKGRPTAHFRFGGIARDSAVAAGHNTVTLHGLQLPAGDERLEAWIENEGEKIGVWDVEVMTTAVAPPTGR